jgi:serine protease Do
MTHLSVVAIAAGLALSAASGDCQAQQAPKAKEKKEIIIREGDDGREKMTIVVDGDKVTVNGKPLSEYEGDDVIVRRRRSGDGAPFVFVRPPMAPMSPVAPMSPLVPMPPMDPISGGKSWRYAWEDDDFPRVNRTPRAFLGVVTEKADKGARIEEVSEGSAAAKAGLREGDIITAVGGKPVSGPESLVELIRARKPEEAVEIAYLRDNKKKTVKARLGKTETMRVEAFEFNMPEFEESFRRGMRDLEPELRRSQAELERAQRELQRAYRDQQREFRFYGTPDMNRAGRPRMGMEVEDTEDGKGARIVDVDSGSPADKAGLKKGDVLVDINNRKISGTDDAVQALRDGRNASSLPVSVMRDGKPFNTTVQMPRDRKKADLEP